MSVVDPVRKGQLEMGALMMSRAFHVLATMSFGDDDAGKVVRIGILKLLKSSVDQLISKEEATFRDRVRVEGEAFAGTGGATGRRLDYGVARVRRYDDKPTKTFLPAEPNVVAARLVALDLPSHEVIEVTTSVNSKALLGMVEQGRLDEAELLKMGQWEAGESVGKFYVDLDEAIVAKLPEL